MRSLFFGLLLLLCGCVTPVPPDKLAKIHSIGVASDCGSVITRESYALLVFGNEITTGDISAWRLDDHAVETISAAVRPRFEVRRIEVDFAALRAWDDALHLASSTPSPDLLRRAIHAPAQPADAYLLIERLELGEGVQRRHGLGVWSTVGGQHAHAFCRLRLIDPKSFEIIAGGRMEEVVPLPSDLRLDRWELYDEAQRQRVRTALEEALAKGLKRILADMKLVP